MSTLKKLILFLISVTLFLVINIDSVLLCQPEINNEVQYVYPGIDPAVQNDILNQDKNFDLTFKTISDRINKDFIRQGVYYLSKDPLLGRVINYSLPGHKLSTLEEADVWITRLLTGWGYVPESDETRVRAFGRDTTKPKAHQYATPPAAAPYFTAKNIFAGKKGTEHPDQVIVIIAHKDSPSWIASPGANDNAIGTCSALELARILNSYQPKYSLRFIFCNEEHTPWTSITAAKAIKTAGLDVLALINMDAVGGKSKELEGHLVNVTRYTTPEGERLADLNFKLNQRFAIGLEQSKYQSKSPGDDDGSFIKAGFPWAVLNIGSMPFSDPNYHVEGDTPDKTDYDSAERVVKLTLALILYLDAYGRP